MNSIDPRVVRTREALRSAIVELAGEQPASSITVSGLARRAGVHRSTVYEHTTSPEELLIGILGEDLDRVRESHVTQALHPREVSLEVLAHLEAHEALYLRELADPKGRVRAFLIEHFQTSMREALREHGPAVRPTMFEEVAPAWTANANVAAMEVWLKTPRPRDTEAFLEVQAALMPAWWPTA